MSEPNNATPISAEIRIVPDGYAVYLGARPPVTFWDLDIALNYIRENLRLHFKVKSIDKPVG